MGEAIWEPLPKELDFAECARMLTLSVLEGEACVRGLVDALHGRYVMLPWPVGCKLHFKKTRRLDFNYADVSLLKYEYVCCPGKLFVPIGYIEMDANQARWLLPAGPRVAAFVNVFHVANGRMIVFIGECTEIYLYCRPLEDALYRVADDVHDLKTFGLLRYDAFFHGTAISLLALAQTDGPLTSNREYGHRLLWRLPWPKDSYIQIRKSAEKAVRAIVHALYRDLSAGRCWGADCVMNFTFPDGWCDDIQLGGIFKEKSKYKMDCIPDYPGNGLTGPNPQYIRLGILGNVVGKNLPAPLCGVEIGIDAHGAPYAIHNQTVVCRLANSLFSLFFIGLTRYVQNFKLCKKGDEEWRVTCPVTCVHSPVVVLPPSYYSNIPQYFDFPVAGED